MARNHSQPPKRRGRPSQTPVGKTALAKRLDKLMRDRGLSGYALAEAAGVDAETVYRILSGRMENPRLDTALALAKALHVSIADLTE